MTTPAGLKAHSVVAYFALTFLISWGGVLVVLGGWSAMTASAPVSDPIFAYALLAMVAGPTVAGITLTTIVYGSAGLHDLLSRVVTWRVGVRWCLAALLTAPLLWLTTIGLFGLASPAVVPALVSSDDRTTLIAAGVAVAVTAGIFEELGWTGFAIPQLRRRHGILVTGLAVGVPWGAWHLLTNVLWAAPVSAGDLPMATFLPLSIAGVLVGYLVAFRVLMVWVYEHTGSVLVAMVMHASLTASVLILDPAGLSGATLLTYSFALAVTTWAAVLVVAWRHGWHLVPAVEQGLRMANDGRVDAIHHLRHRNPGS